MDNDVQQCESAVEVARAKLIRDLDVLSSPATFSAFTESMKTHALEAKDAIVEQARDAVHDKVGGLLEDLKAKAAANPAATLTIGAGVAWHFLRHPPIATALIGAGLFSLLRTDGARLNGGVDAYLRRGTERLKEQAGEFGAAAKDAASDMGRTAADKAAGLAGSAAETVREWSQSAAGGVAEVGSSLGAGAEAATDSARRLVHDVRDFVRDASGKVSDDATRLAHKVVERAEDIGADITGSAGSLMGSARSIAASGDTRDKLLLGVAGLAVAAALGMAYQKRIAEEVE